MEDREMRWKIENRQIRRNLDEGTVKEERHIKFGNFIYLYAAVLSEELSF